MSRKNEATSKMLTLRLIAILREDKTTLLNIMLYILALASHHDMLGLVVETSAVS